MRLTAFAVLSALSAAGAAGELLGDSIEQATRAAQTAAENARHQPSPAERAARQKAIENAQLAAQHEAIRRQSRDDLLNGRMVPLEQKVQMLDIENELAR